MTFIVSFKMVQLIQIMTILSGALAYASVKSKTPEKLGIPHNLPRDKRDGRKVSGYWPPNKGRCDIFPFVFASNYRYGSL